MKDACAHLSVLLSMGLSPLEKWPPLLLLLLRFLPASLPVPLELAAPLPLPLALPLSLASETCRGCLRAACRCGRIRSAVGSLLPPSWHPYTTGVAQSLCTVQKVLSGKLHCPQPSYAKILQD